MTFPAPIDLPTRDLFRLDDRTILSASTTIHMMHESSYMSHAVSGGAGAVGSTVGKAVLESGGDAVLVDLASAPSAETWSSSYYR